jgi:predicted RNA-binding Zn-ribbon protein involved in translation (DUF1610 family)
MTEQDLQCPSCKVVISRGGHELRPPRQSCPYCGSGFDYRSRRGSMKGAEYNRYSNNHVI